VTGNSFFAFNIHTIHTTTRREEKEEKMLKCVAMDESDSNEITFTLSDIRDEKMKY
jgi:hypothetical protein